MPKIPLKRNAFLRLPHQELPVKKSPSLCLSCGKKLIYPRLLSKHPVDSSVDNVNNFVF